MEELRKRCDVLERKCFELSMRLGIEKRQNEILQEELDKAVALLIFFKQAEKAGSIQAVLDACH